MTLQQKIVAACSAFPAGATAADIAAKMGRVPHSITPHISRARYYGALNVIGQREVAVKDRIVKHNVYKVAPPPEPMRFRPGVGMRHATI